MAIGTTNLAATPCCGVIRRTWEAVPDEAFPTGVAHAPGDFEGVTISCAEDAPTFTREQTQLSRGICPDCGRSFAAWLRANGGRETRDGWRWDYSAAERAYADRG